VKPRARSSRCRLAAGGVLAVGWAIALAIYATAEPVAQDPDIEAAQLTKSYERQMEVFGGKAALVGTQLEEGFASLWQGQRLAYAVGVLSAIAALGSYFVCRMPPLDVPPE
jgi:hypothetical protein